MLACHLQFDADPDPTNHFDVDPDPNFQFDADPQHLFAWQVDNYSIEDMIISLPALWGEFLLYIRFLHDRLI